MSEQTLSEPVKKFLRLFFFRLNIRFGREFPRHSIRAAKKKFGDKPITVVELGVAEGKNALSMLRTLNIKKLYLVDPYICYDDYSREKRNLLDQDKVYLKAKKRLEEYSDKLVWIFKKSEDSVEDIPMSDFIYVDANHRYDFAKRDMMRYFDKVKPGGVLGGHDISEDPDVQRAFCEFVIEKGLQPHMSRTDWWVEVKK